MGKAMVSGKVAFTLALFAALAYKLTQPPGPVDLAVYRAAGNAVLNGVPLYAPNFGELLSTSLPFTYPPIAAVLSVPLAPFPLGLDYLAWTAASLVLLVVLLKRLTNLSHLDLLLIAAVAVWLVPVTGSLVMGQLGIIITVGCIFGCLSARPWVAGVIGVLAAVKLTPLLFLVYFAITKQWQRLAWASAGFGVSTVIGWLLLPDETREYFLNLLGDSQRVGDPGFYANQSILGVTTRLGLDDLWWVVLAGATALCGLFLARRLFNRGEILGGAVTVGMTTLLISPITWQHHAVWIVPTLIYIYLGTSSAAIKWMCAAITALSLLNLPLWTAGIGGTGFFEAVPVAVLQNSGALIYAWLLLLIAYEERQRITATETRVQPLSVPVLNPPPA